MPDAQPAIGVGFAGHLLGHPKPPFSTEGIGAGWKIREIPESLSVFGYPGLNIRFDPGCGEYPVNELDFLLVHFPVCIGGLGHQADEGLLLFSRHGF